MPYTPSQAKAIKKYREKKLQENSDYIHYVRDQVRRSREKWRGYTLESRRLCMIQI